MGRDVRRTYHGRLGRPVGLTGAVRGPIRMMIHFAGPGSSSMGVFGARVMPCPAEERPSALEVLYRRMPRSLRGHLIAEVLEDQKRGELDLSGLWVAQIRSGRIVGAMMTQALAGKAAALWPPEVRPSWRRAALAAALVQAALDDLAARGYRLVAGGAGRVGRPAGRTRPDPRRHAPRDRAALPRARYGHPPAPACRPSGPGERPRARCPGHARPRLRLAAVRRRDRGRVPGGLAGDLRGQPGHARAGRRRGGSRTSSPATGPPVCSCPSAGNWGGSPASRRPRPCCS